MSVVCGDCIRYYHVKLCLVYALSLYIFIYKFVLYTTIFCLVNKSCVLPMVFVATSFRLYNYSSPS